jgi:hypothetical protein
MANAYEIPGLRYSLVAGGAVARYRFVAVNASGLGIVATAATPLVGASYNEVAVGEVLEVVGDGIAIVAAGEAVAAGATVYADSAGKATDVAGTIVAGVALTAATAADQLISVKLV